jgi:hypothetical protein
MKKLEKGRTFLLRDEKNLIIEVTCRTTFPNLEIVELSLNNDANQINLNDNISRIILATTNKEITTKVLLLHESHDIDVIPFLYTNADNSKLSERTLIQIIHFEFFRLKFATLRTKTNFFVNYSLFNVTKAFENRNLKLESINSNPLIFHSLINAIEANNTRSFIAFSNKLNDLQITYEQILIDELLLFLKDTDKLNTIATLFSESIQELFNYDKFKKINSSLLSFFIGLAITLENNIFKLKEAWFCTMVFAIAFDVLGSHKNKIHKLKSLNHNENNFADNISIFTLASIFNNDHYISNGVEFKKNDLTKNEEIYNKSSLMFINIANSKQSLTLYEKFDLSRGYFNNVLYLIRGN